MIQATSILLIVAGISTATYATDLPPNVACQCNRTGQVVVALKSDLIRVPLDGEGFDENQTPFPWAPEVKSKKWVYVVIHHSATESGSVESIHNSHKLRKDQQGLPWLGIGYHFVIGNGSGMQDGKVEATFRWKQQLHGAHSGSAVHNANGIGVCLIGNFEERKPTKKQLAAISNLVSKLARKYKIPSRLVIGHNTVKPTACPGKLFPLQDVKRNSLVERKTGRKFAEANSQRP